VTAANLLFLASAAVALLGALLAVALRNIFHNILGFAFGMLGVAGIFACLGSDFLAAVFVLVYVGAVAIAMVYAVMLSQPLDQPHRPRSGWKIAGAGAVALGVALTLWRILGRAQWLEAAPGGDSGAARAGTRFLTDYVLAFELVSVLLLVAMMGAVMVARRSRPGRGAW
jgi:NADH:ubiquinone oxidoreductase subunit 6 (subunit J)